MASPAAAASASNNVTAHNAAPAASSAAPAHAAALALATPDNTPANGQLPNALGGRTFDGSIHVDNYKVPLPSGEWVILSNGRYHTPLATGEAVLLGQIHNRRLVGAIRIATLRSIRLNEADFPPRIKGCAGDTSLYVDPARENDGAHQACWSIDSVFTLPMQRWADRSTKLDPLMRAAAGDLAAKGVSYPQDLVRIHMTLTESWGVLEVSYMFSPEASGIHSNDARSVNDTDWTPSNIGRYPDKLAYIEKMKTWGSHMWPSLKSDFAASASGR